MTATDRLRAGRLALEEDRDVRRGLRRDVELHRSSADHGAVGRGAGERDGVVRAHGDVGYDEGDREAVLEVDGVLLDDGRSPVGTRDHPADRVDRLATGQGQRHADGADRIPEGAPPWRSCRPLLGPRPCSSSFIGRGATDLLKGEPGACRGEREEHHATNGGRPRDGCMRFPTPNARRWPRAAATKSSHLPEDPRRPRAATQRF